ncbi:KCTD3 [Symbiodinium necroappetens]|uniref:KCTD3 protein n=1 Tax=Symbiodinium necroappetens TaxID=1628268 RepID=A0A812WGI7_9DINO|nr:KCTD3 [Symbiodinium necroappetens]
MPMVKLNVGGRMFRTSESTLRACGDFCARLLDGEIPVDRDEDGVLFLDRDPDLFDWVLRFARTGEIQKDMPGALKAEFDFLLLSWPPCCQRCGVYFDTARNSDTSCRHHRFPWLEDVEISREDRACCPWPERSEKGCCKNCGTEICGRQVFKSYVRRYICCKGRIDVLGGLAFVLVALLGPAPATAFAGSELDSNWQWASDFPLRGPSTATQLLNSSCLEHDAVVVKAEEVAVEVQDPAQKRKEEQERRKAEAKAKREEEEQRRKDWLCGSARGC